MSDWLYYQFVSPLSETYFQKALIGGSLVAVVCSVIGCFVILRRMAFLGDALSHAMLAGVTAGYLVMRLFFGDRAHAPAMLAGSILSAVVTVGMIGFISRVSRIKEDTAIGIMYTGIFAFGGVLASLFADKIHVDLLHFVMGQVLAVNDADLWVSAIVAAGVLSVVILFFRSLQLTSFDPVMAASLGVPVVLFDYLLTTCTSFVVVSGVTMLGVILVVGLLLTPAATAYLLCERLARMLAVSAVFGVTSVVGGLYLSVWANVAGGSAIVLFSTLQFMVVLTVAPRHGLLAAWLRRRAIVPQQLVEDVLRSVAHSAPQPMLHKELEHHVPVRADEIRRAVSLLDRRGLLTQEGERLALTPAGEIEARKLIRAHRLWETYLRHVGMPDDQLHRRAHELEHVHDEEAVDYLDSKLGHPLTDPHGSEIPEDFVHLVPGNRVKASLLREGHQARVISVGEAAAGISLAAGDEVRIGPRLAAENQWTLILSAGRTVHLDQKAADAVVVEVESTASAT
jgi:manganese/iron transport system permease protein/iron/zinc/copper transport system permease protein